MSVSLALDHGRLLGRGFCITDHFKQREVWHATCCMIRLRVRGAYR